MRDRALGQGRRVLAALLGTGLLLAGCSADEPGPSPTYTADSTVIQPGRPGEPATTLTPGQTGTRAPAPTFNAADVAFARDMIRHHSQAVEMTKLAPGRAADPRVRSLAERIAAVQVPEVEYLRTWLTSRRQLVTDPGSHGHAMPGMVTPAQLKALGEARAGAFDRMFLTLMVDHHRGAVSMSNALLTAGNEPMLQELAEEISAGQAAEINRMLDVSASLG